MSKSLLFEKNKIPKGDWESNRVYKEIGVYRAIFFETFYKQSKYTILDYTNIYRIQEDCANDEGYIIGVVKRHGFKAYHAYSYCGNNFSDDFTYIYESFGNPDDANKFLLKRSEEDLGQAFELLKGI